MSCSVAVSNSPVFSPSSSLFFNKTSIISPSPDALNLTLTHLKPSSSPASPSPSSPSSPFRLRLQKPPPGSLLSSSSSSASTSSSSSGSGSTAGLGPGSVSTILKRKRPARLDIPVATTAMCFGVPTTPCEVRREVEREGDGYTVYCKRGRREAMEDRFSASVKLQGGSKQAFFGVFDGHGGAKAAEFAAQKLEKNIIDEFARRRDNTKVEDAVKEGYLKTDAEFLKEDVTGGTCCVTALIRNGNLVVSNAGDCRAVMSRGGVAEALTSDHRPSREDERNRIETLGGYVDLCHGVWRIQGCLAVSRGIGDQHLKQWVIAEPETKIISIKPDCEFLILASDGLWDKVSNQEAVDIARPSCVGINKQNPLFACKKLVDLSVSRGSSDDISVILIQLGRYI
ncbi:probable protein phosphatase 2C 25 [Herrania umbratica]|uniref:protein-serine/threonine phosphatase n=1 Tax=Herrania umbratica TaxID=108875 RepID=A0A6J0ZW22_9ROSI|nr:probable protein phosphatase 2C 25 [Herrania umbratica]